MSEGIDWRKAFQEYTATKRAEGDAEARGERLAEEEAEETRVWKSLDQTRAYVKRLRLREATIAASLVAAAMRSSDPVVRGLAWRLEELNMELKDLA